MSDRDRIASLLALHRLRLQARPKRDDVVAARCMCGVVIAYTGPTYEKRAELRARIQRGWEEHRADALIAAGVTVPPSPPCGTTSVIDGIEYTCELQPHTHPYPVHQCTDDIGVMVWRVGPNDPEVLVAWTHDGRKR